MSEGHREKEERKREREGGREEEARHEGRRRRQKERPRYGERWIKREVCLQCQQYSIMYLSEYYAICTKK